MNLLPESGGQATGLCSAQCQLPARGFCCLTDGVGDCIRNTDAGRDARGLDSDHRHLLGTFAQQHGRLEQLGYIAFMGGGSAAAGVTPTAQNVNRSGLRSQGHGVQNQQRAAVGDAAEQRPALGTAIQEFHLATPLGGIPL